MSARYLESFNASELIRSHGRGAIASSKVCRVGVDNLVDYLGTIVDSLGMNGE